MNKNNFLKFFILIILLIIYNVNINASIRYSYFYKNQIIKKNNNLNKIISLAPIISEILFSLGLNKEIIGITKYCNYPVNSKKQKIGGFTDPQLEIILSLNPDLVIATPTRNTFIFLEQLIKHKIPILLGFTDNLTEIYNFLFKIALLTNKEKKAKYLLRKSEVEISKLKNILLTKKKMPSKTILIVSSNEMIAANNKTFAAKLITYMGLECIIKTKFINWPIISIENLLINTPNIIILMQGKKYLNQIKKKIYPIIEYKQLRSSFIFSYKNQILMKPGVFLYKDAKIIKNLIRDSF